MVGVVVIVVVVVTFATQQSSTPVSTGNAARSTAVQTTAATARTTVAASASDPTTVGLPAGAVPCPVVYPLNATRPVRFSARGNEVTSCPFAESVKMAYLSADGVGQALTITAFSPVTNKQYEMTCQAGTIIVCTGGNDALVYLY